MHLVLAPVGLFVVSREH